MGVNAVFPLLVLSLGLLDVPTRAVAIEVPLETDFYRLRLLTFEEVRDAAQPFLSSAGKHGYAPNRNVLIIHDHPRQSETVKGILQEVDTAPANIRVEVAVASVTTGAGHDHPGDAAPGDAPAPWSANGAGKLGDFR
jgi:hypothetical protein